MSDFFRNIGQGLKEFAQDRSGATKFRQRREQTKMAQERQAMEREKFEEQKRQYSENARTRKQEAELRRNSKITFEEFDKWDSDRKESFLNFKGGRSSTPKKSAFMEKEEYLNDLTSVQTKNRYERDHGKGSYDKGKKNTQSTFKSMIKSRKDLQALDKDIFENKQAMEQLWRTEFKPSAEIGGVGEFNQESKDNLEYLQKRQKELEETKYMMESGISDLTQNNQEAPISQEQQEMPEIETPNKEDVQKIKTQGQYINQINSNIDKYLAEGRIKPEDVDKYKKLMAERIMGKSAVDQIIDTGVKTEMSDGIKAMFNR